VNSEPNSLLRAAREAGGLTQGQLAELANAQVEQATGKPGAMDADYIGKLERGVHHWPNRDYRLALRHVLRCQSDAGLGFFSTRSRAATVERHPQYVNGGDDVERKAFLRVLAGSVAGLAFTDPLSDFASAASASGDRQVGHFEVEQVRRMARLFAEQDHRYGGGLSAQAAVTQLSTSIDFLDAGFAKETVRRQYFAAVADLADTAAGMCFDAGSHQRAERCFRFAVGSATEAGDWSMRAKALSGLANLAVHQSRPDDALSYAEMALVRADRLTSTTRAVMHSRHARALGLIGSPRAQDCLAAVRQAEDCFVSSSNSGDEPSWIAYYNQAHLERDLGRALLHLGVNGGDYREAQRRLSTAVAQFPSGSSRGKALAMANLAHLTMVRDDPNHAATLGTEALQAMGSVRSDRVLDALRQLRIAGQRHRNIPAVRALNRSIDQTLRASRA
jgi:transcriptional regulator with XRE-family HTH domain